MKTIIFTMLLLFISWRLSAPEVRAFYIEKAKAINPYKKIIYAIGKVECNFDTTVINWNELAFGYFQIRPVRLRDYNNRTGSDFTMQDMLDYDKAETVFMYYAVKSGWRNPEQIARRWNGGHENGMKYKQTANYWNQVKKYY
jgi:hypothetical protein